MTIFIFVPGILSVPGSAYNWVGRATTWTNTETPHKAEKVEYFSGAILRPIRQSGRVHKLQRMLRFCHNMHIHLVGHSNGCAVIVDALKLLHRDGGKFLRFQSLHLVSAACERDFKINGLNLWADRIDRTVCYIARMDKALYAADTRLGRWLGYGTLGKYGPVNAANPVEMIYRNHGHSDWWAPDRFDKMMRSLTDDPSPPTL